MLSSQEIEDTFHTLDRHVSKSWDVRDRSVKIKMPLHPQRKRKANKQNKQEHPVHLQKLAWCTVHNIHLGTKKILVGWRMDDE